MKDSDPRVRAVEVCVQNLQSGEAVEDLSVRYPDLAGLLRPTLETARAARRLAATTEIPEEAITRSRTIFLQEAIQAARQTVFPYWVSKFWRPGLLAISLVMIFALGLIGAAIASANSLPGDQLYPAKLAVTQIRRWMTIGPGQRLLLEQALDQQQIQEVQRLVQLHRSGPVSFTGALNALTDTLQSSGSDWQVGGVRVRLSETTLAFGQVKEGIFVQVKGDLQADGIVLARDLRVREFILVGKLQLRQNSSETPGDSAWLVDGIVFQVTPETVIEGAPQPGEWIEARLVKTTAGALLARWMRKSSSAANQ